MKKRFDESIYYQIRLTARYAHLWGVQFLEKINAGISLEELIILETIHSGGEICQRDIAKIVLKDRANTGRTLSLLEEKKLIKTVIDTKNNRLVKKPILTKKGDKLFKEILAKFKPLSNKVEQDMSGEEKEQLAKILGKYRGILSSIIEIQI